MAKIEDRNKPGGWMVRASLLGGMVRTFCVYELEDNKAAELARIAIAADGHRLARLATATSSTLSADRSLIVPRELLKTIDRMLGKAAGMVTLRRSARLVSIEGAAFQIVGRLIDAEYPDTARIIPAGYPNAATCSRARLIKSLERFAAVADPQDAAHAVHVRWNDRDGLHLSTPDGSADCLAADVEGEAETTAQVRYIAELLEAMHGDRVTIAAGKPGSPIIITDPDDSNFLALQMPIQPRSS
jgi:DNA polymerase-3 subunit beta